MPGSELVQALSRGLEIIRMAARSENGLRISEIAEKLGVKPSTAYNLVRTLISGGFIEKNGAGLHKPGSALFEISGEYSRRAIIRRAEELLKDLRRTAPGMILTYFEPSASGMRVVLRMSPDLPGVTQRPDNMSFNPYGTASGLLFFAFADESARARAESLTPFDEYGSHRWKSRRNFDAMIESVRKKRYAVRYPQETRMYALAAPVFDHRNHFVGCLGMSTTPKAENNVKKQMALKILRGAVAKMMAENGTGY